MSENQEKEQELQESIVVSWDEARAMGLLDDLEKPKSFRHTLIFDNEISMDSVQGLINELGTHQTVDLFFSTNGGQITAMGALLHYLNMRKEDIAVYLTDEVCSAGTLLLTDFKGELHLTDNLDFILFHLGDRMTYNRRKGDISRTELLKQLDVINAEKAIKFTELGLTPQEIRRYKSGKDVILYRKDFGRLNLNRKEE